MDYTCLNHDKLSALFNSSPKWTLKKGVWTSGKDRIELDGEDIIVNGKKMSISELYEKDGIIYHKEIEGFHAVERNLFKGNGGDWIEIGSS